MVNHNKMLIELVYKTLHLYKNTISYYSSEIMHTLLTETEN